jgi:hypothetical protein
VGGGGGGDLGPVTGFGVMTIAQKMLPLTSATKEHDLNDQRTRSYAI